MDSKFQEPGSSSRRNFIGAVAAAAGGLAVGGGLAPTAAQAQQASAGARKGKTVALNWKEVFFTNCPMVSANNIDQELGWCKTDFKKIGQDFMLSHGYIKNDFDVSEWAAPESLEAAAKELIKERGVKVTMEKLPAPAARFG